jgi:hypothetical protein
LCPLSRRLSLSTSSRRLQEHVEFRRARIVLGHSKCKTPMVPSLRLTSYPLPLDNVCHDERCRTPRCAGAIGCSRTKSAGQEVHRTKVATHGHQHAANRARLRQKPYGAFTSDPASRTTRRSPSPSESVVQFAAPVVARGTAPPGDTPTQANASCLCARPRGQRRLACTALSLKRV